MKKRIIVLSGKQFSGKDTVAKLLLESLKGFTRVGLGDAIKLEYAEQKGLTLEQIESNKSEYRPDLITLGDAGRAKDPDFWIKKIIDLPYDIIVPDVRMLRELEMFAAAGAFTIRVNSNETQRALRGKLSSQNDLTETQLDDITSWHAIVENDSDYESLVDTTKALTSRLKEFFS